VDVSFDGCMPALHGTGTPLVYMALQLRWVQHSMGQELGLCRIQLHCLKTE